MKITNPKTIWVSMESKAERFPDTKNGKNFAPIVSKIFQFFSFPKFLSLSK
jgi:hypothetical protein